MIRLRIAGGIIIALMLAGCAGTQLAAPAPKSTPKITMAGHWTLSTPTAPPCVLNFEGAPGDQQGAIHPAGGCPGKFFMSRFWELDHSKLTIDDYQENPLATLKLTSTGFKGKSNAGTTVTLAR